MNNAKMPVAFPGFAQPSDDMFAVRSELRANVFYRDIDLSTARSLAAGTAQTLTLAGNFFYVDQKANSGFATIHFQDDASVGNTPVTVYPGFMAKVPYTQIILENTAQPGQVLRVLYGTDVSFLPVPSAAGVTVLNSLSVSDLIGANSQILNYLNAAEPVGAANVYTMLAPAANVRGAKVRGAMIQLAAGGGGTANVEIVAASAAPVSLQAAQSNALCVLRSSNSSTVSVVTQERTFQTTVPAGWGIYLSAQVGVAAASVLGRVDLELL